MNTIISNDIVIKNPSSFVRDFAKKELIVNNPEYQQMKILGKEDLIKWKHIPEKLNLFVEKSDKLVFPFGTLRSLYDEIIKYPYELKFNNAGDISVKNDSPTFELYDYQEEAVKTMVKAKGGVLVAPCGAGKGLPLDTKIYTPNGWKKNGDLIIGDKVIGANGKPTIVTNIFDRGLVEAFKLIFSDNTQIICDKDHLWNVQSQSQRNDKAKYKTMSTSDIYNYYKKITTRGKELYIPIVKPVEFEHKDVNLDAWLLGILIADGCFKNNRVCVSNAEKDIIEKIEKLNDGLPLKKLPKYDYKLNKNILKKIRELKLDNIYSYEKFIPDIYKYNDIQTRLSLLQGLFDGDGNVSKAVYEFSTTSKRLAEDIIEIIQSLGGTAKVKERQTFYTYKNEKKAGRISYRIFFKLYDFYPFTSEKHNKKYIKRKKYINAYRIIKKIEPVEPIISRCITVDAPDQLYVIENFIVTHNTVMGIEIIRRIGKKALWLCHTGDLLRQAMDDMLEQYPNIKIGLTTKGKLEIGKDVTISTIQTMEKIDPDLYKNEFDVVVCDECAHVAASPTQMKMFAKVISKIPARYKYGLTATPTRSDGMIKAMYCYIGTDKDGDFKPMFKVDKREVNTIQSIHKKFELYNGYDKDYEKMYSLYDSAGMMNYNNLISELSKNKKRNEKIINNILECHKEGRKQVVLCLRVTHCELLKQELENKGIKVQLCVGKVSDKKRKQILKQEIEWDVIVATYSLLKEGVSIKELDTLHMTVPIADKGMVVQCAGRIERYLENKKQPIIYDYVDMDIPYCEKKFNLRKRYLKTRF